MSLGVINPDEFAGALKAQGGASASVRTGMAPQSGYFVSEHGSEEVVPGYAQAQDVSGFGERKAAPLAAEKAYLGGWVEGHQSPEAETYLDVSRHFPEDKNQALQHGRQEGQYAIYDASRGQVIPTFQPPNVRGTLLNQIPNRRAWRKEDDAVSNAYHVKKRRNEMADEDALRKTKAAQHEAQKGKRQSEQSRWSM